MLALAGAQFAEAAVKCFAALVGLGREANAGAFQLGVKRIAEGVHAGQDFGAQGRAGGGGIGAKL